MKIVKVYGTKPAKHPFPIISWLIRIVEWSKISHVGLYFDDEEEVFNAHFNDVEFVDYDEYMKINKVVYSVTIPLTNSEYDSLRESCENLVQRQSGYWATLIGVLIPHIIRTLFGKLMKHPFPKGYTCSWVLYEVLTGLGHKFSKEIDPPNCTTKDIIEFAKEITQSIPKSRFNQIK